MPLARFMLACIDRCQQMLRNMMVEAFGNIKGGMFGVRPTFTKPMEPPRWKCNHCYSYYRTLLFTHVNGNGAFSIPRPARLSSGCSRQQPGSRYECHLWINVNGVNCKSGKCEIDFRVSGKRLALVWFGILCFKTLHIRGDIVNPNDHLYLCYTGTCCSDPYAHLFIPDEMDNMHRFRLRVNHATVFLRLTYPRKSTECFRFQMEWKAASDFNVANGFTRWI